MKAFHLTEAAEEIGVSAVTLRRWFLEGQIDEVRKDRNGWRVFTSEDIDRIKHFRRTKRNRRFAPYNRKVLEMPGRQN